MIHLKARGSMGGGAMCNDGSKVLGDTYTSNFDDVDCPVCRKYGPETVWPVTSAEERQFMISSGKGLGSD